MNIGTPVTIVGSRTSLLKRFIGKKGIIDAIGGDIVHPYTVYFGPQARIRHMRFSPQEIVLTDEPIGYSKPPPKAMTSESIELLLAWDKKRMERENRRLSRPMKRIPQSVMEISEAAIKRMVEKSQLAKIKEKQQWIEQGEVKDKCILGTSISENPGQM